MSKSRQRVLPVLLATAALVGAANLGAYATNGAPLLSGKTNRESKPTAVVNKGKGPALKLTSKPNAPSLSVSSAVKVSKLNADRVDGLDGAALQNQLTHFVVPTTTPANSTEVTFQLPPGNYLMSYAFVLTGDPFACFTTDLPNTGLTFATAGGLGAASATSSTVVTVPGSGEFSLTCNSASSTVVIYSAQGDALSTVDFLRLDRVVTGAEPDASRSRGATPGGTVTSGR